MHRRPALGSPRSLYGSARCRLQYKTAKAYHYHAIGQRRREKTSRARAVFLGVIKFCIFQMSQSSFSKSASEEDPVPKKQKLDDEANASSPKSAALRLSSFGFGSAGVKSHMEDAHVMCDEYARPSPSPCHHGSYRWSFFCSLWSVLPSSMKPAHSDPCSFYGVFDGHVLPPSQCPYHLLHVRM
jgi:hypothetical protein